MDTQLACLTPPGKAAIATLAVRGPRAWPITRELFRPHKGELPVEPTSGRYWLGKLGTAHADDAILAAKIDCLELHCHGGVEVVRMIEELYVERGAVVVVWQQFGGDPLLAMLAQAPTTRTAAILLDQAAGAWQTCMEKGVDATKLRRLERLIPLGKHLVEPWKIVIAGAPNVGKSSLMNALAGYTRSIVSPIPGTTRDVVTVRLAIDGWPVEFTDTAGMRESSSELERQGVERAQQALADAWIKIWVLDGSAEPVFPDDSYEIVINKVDLPAHWDWDRYPLAPRVSAVTGQGIAEWCAWMSWALVPEPPLPAEAVPCLPGHFEWVRTSEPEA